MAKRTRAPAKNGASGSATQIAPKRDPDETADLHKLVADLIDDSSLWWNTPHELLGGKKPKELLGTRDEERVRELVRAIKLGMAL